LTEAGVCARGVTPRFYGTIENIDPTSCLPHLKAFIKDEYPPTAILLEYIPNMKELRWSNYNEKRMQNFVDGLNAIDSALVQHGDVYPRNMMIIEGDPERAIWLDFDRAQTFNGELITERQKGWIAFEKRLMSATVDFMVCPLFLPHSSVMQICLTLSCRMFGTAEARLRKGGIRRNTSILLVMDRW
jgi:hypothetical protein